MFDPSKDKITISIPEFRMKRGSDIGRNEIGIVAFAIDSAGSANSSTSFFTNSFYFPKVNKWSWVKLGGVGRLVYGPKNPGSFVYYNVQFIESDQDVREFGESMKSVFESDEIKGIRDVLSTINPTVSIISAVGAQIGSIVGKILSKNKNDHLFTTEGTFLRDLEPPYNIGDKFSSSNDFIECPILVTPLVERNNKTKMFGALESLTDVDENNGALELSYQSGKPKEIN